MTINEFMDTATARQLKSAWAKGQRGPMFEYKSDNDKWFVKKLAAEVGGRVETKLADWRMAYILPVSK